MARFGISLSPMGLLLIGFTLEHNYLSPWFLSFMGLAACWAATELYIALCLHFDNQVPKRLWITASRIGWLPVVAIAWFDSNQKWSLPWWHDSLAFYATFLMWIGFGIRLVAIINLGKSFSYDLRVAEEQKLHTKGLFAFIRHPSYLGLILLTTIPGLILGSLPGFILLCICTIPQILFRINAEEEILHNHYGEKFLEYTRRTKRLIPCIY